MSETRYCPQCRTIARGLTCENDSCHYLGRTIVIEPPASNADKEIADLRTRLAEAQARNAQILRDFHAEIHDGQGESAHDVIQRLVREKQEAQARAERAEGVLENVRRRCSDKRDSAREASKQALTGEYKSYWIGQMESVELVAGWLMSLTPSSQRSDGERLDGLRELCGYIEAGEGESITIGQDDATKEWTLCVGKRWWHAGSFRGVIDAAIAVETKEGGGE